MILNPCSRFQSDSSFLLDSKDINRKVSNETFLYYRCSKCQLIFLANIPDNLGDYYAGYHKFPKLAELAQTAFRERFKIEIVQKFIQSGKLLEIGPSIGVFAYQAKQTGFEVDVTGLLKSNTNPTNPTTFFSCNDD